MTEDALYSIQELADLGEVSRRTIRYYIQRELLPEPTGVGRGKHYTDVHLEALQSIKALQDEGLTLEQIKERFEDAPGGLAGGVEAVSTSLANMTLPGGGEAWARLAVVEGVELHVRADIAEDMRHDLERAHAMLQIMFAHATKP